jgi:serine-type D-Ala-D-Ala carboxypeptidase (penicillin-binding protein 5/6)
VAKLRADQICSSAIFLMPNISFLQATAARAALGLAALLCSCQQNSNTYPTGGGGNTSYYNGGNSYTPPQPSYTNGGGRLPSTPPPAIHAESYVLIDADTGQTLASKRPDSVRPVASTQKLLTALVVCEDGNLDAPVRIQAADTRCEPTKFGLRPGQVFSRRELLGGLLVKSCNDIAMALARDNAGTIPAFSQRMNYKARSLGATNSQFSNPHGLTAGSNYSTARDMARIARAAYFNSTIRSFTSRRSTYVGGQVLKSTNDLLGQMPECNGLKTGYTIAAGRCLVSSASRGGRNVILVQLGTKTRYIWDDGRMLMNWGLNG